MQTSQDLSTISYNSPGYLKIVLDQLVEEGQLEFYFFISHLKEDDELKDHIHLYMSPNRKLDTAKLKKRFIEPDPQFGLLKPLGIVAFRKSDIDHWWLYDMHYPPYLASIGQSRKYRYDIDHWWLYDMHYPPYLASIGQSRKYRYDIDQVVTNDCVTADYWWHHARFESEWAIKNKLTKEIRESITPVDLIDNGRIPLAQASSLLAYTRMKSQTWRNGRANHENNQYVKNVES